MQEILEQRDGLEVQVFGPGGTPELARATGRLLVKRDRIQAGEELIPGRTSWELELVYQGQPFVKALLGLNRGQEAPLLVRLQDGREGPAHLGAAYQDTIMLVGNGALELPPALATKRRVDSKLRMMGFLVTEEELRDDPELIKAALDKVAHGTREFREELGRLPLEAILRIMEQADSFGCFFDPTGWDRTRTDRQFNAELLRLAQRFHLGVAKLISDREGCGKIHALQIKGSPCPLCGGPGEGKEPDQDKATTLMGRPVIEEELPGAQEAVEELQRGLDAGRHRGGQDVQADPPSGAGP